MTSPAEAQDLPSPPKPPRKRRGPWRLVVASLVTAGLLGFLVEVASPARLWAILRDVAWLPLLFALLVYASNNLVRAQRFKVLGANAGLGSLYAVASLHAILLRVLPFRSGDLSYAPLLRAVGGGGLSRGLAGIVVMRLVDMTVLFIVAALFIGSGMLPKAQPGVQNLAMLGFATACLVLLYWRLEAITRAGLAGVAWAVRTLHLQRTERIEQLLGRLGEELAYVRNVPPLEKVKLFTLTLLFWAHNFGVYYLTIYALGARLSAVEMLTFSVFGVAGSMIPLSAVGTFGFQEAGFAVGLMAIGIESRRAVALGLSISILTLLVSFVAAMPFGSWLLLGRRSIKES